MSALFIILVSLMTFFSAKVLISNRCISGLMSKLIKKSWTVSNGDPLPVMCVSWMFDREMLPKFKDLWFGWIINYRLSCKNYVLNFIYIQRRLQTLKNVFDLTFWPKNDGEKWSRENIFEIPRCIKPWITALDRYLRIFFWKFSKLNFFENSFY